MRTAVAVTCASAALLAGCGDDDSGSSSDRLSKAEYERAFKALVEQATEEGSLSLPKFDGSEPPADVAAAFERFQTGLRSFASGMDRIRPPADVESAHRKWIRGLRLVASDLQTFVDLRRAGDDAGIRRAVVDLDSVLPDEHNKLVTDAAAEIETKGYDLGSPEGATP